MKIRNDFVTNSSSTSFIFGTPNSITETVDTIFNLTRMISHEILFIRDMLLISINDYSEYKKLVCLDVNSDNYYEKYVSLVKKLISSDDFELFYSKLLSESFLVSESENDDMYEFLSMLNDKQSIEQYQQILNYSSYSNYANGLEYKDLYIYDVQESDKEFCNRNLHPLVTSYYYRKSDDGYIDYDSIHNKIDNITNIKSFVLNKLGNIYLSYEECSFMHIFENTLDYFSNISYNLSQ